MANILVVDDNAINRKLLVALLSGDGHLTQEAVDGIDGLAVARTQRPQLIISDILMPSMDGYGFVRALRQDPVLRGTPVIFYTAHYHEREAHNLAEACGVSRVLVKPCPHAEILRAVEQAMAGVNEAPLPSVPEDFDREHLRLLTDKLSERADALAASNARFAALAELNLQIASEPDAHLLLERVCAGARSLIGARYAVLAVADEGDGVYFTTSGIDTGGVPLKAPDLQAGILGNVFMERAPWRTCRSEGIFQNPGLPLGYPPEQAYVCVPLMTPTRVYGWLCLAGKIGAMCFDAADERLLETLGAVVGRYYENVRLQEELQRQNSRLRRIYALLGGINVLVGESHDTDDVYNAACRLLVERGGYRMAMIEFSESREGKSRCIAVEGSMADVERFARARGGRRDPDDLSEASRSTDGPALCNDLSATQLTITQRSELVAAGIRAIAVLPLRNTAAGRLVLMSERSGHFDDAELRLLNEFVGGISVAAGLLSDTAPI
jgi:CheY-like chemotaxis protein/GAF domain-containing protein